ncbi:MAG TPA: hypothetical protein VK427_08110, partial [Kofleriaceae bacterium]|nr:hypothetical protein [Kofleriaceae bacterium]
MDLDALYRKLEFATFSQREQIAVEIVRDTPREELAPLVRALEHPTANVRLGVIEIFRRAAYRESLRRLLAHAQASDGDDRVFSARAIADLAEPGDGFLLDAARGWATSNDAFLAAHGTRLVELLTRVKVPSGTAQITARQAESLDKLVVRLFTAVKGSERMALVEQIEQRGAGALAAAAKVVFAKGNDALVAYISRALIRNAGSLAAPEKLIPLLESARRRLDNAPIADAAIDDALLALGGVAMSPQLLARIGDMDKPQVDAVVGRLGERTATEVALHVPVLLDALGRKPALWSSIGPALAYAAAEVRETTRKELRDHVERVFDELRRAKSLPPTTLVSATWVFAKIAEAGEALPRQLRLALDRLAVAEASRALAALASR